MTVYYFGQSISLFIVLGVCFDGYGNRNKFNTDIFVLLSKTT